MDFAFISPKTINPRIQQTFSSGEAAHAKKSPLDRLTSPFHSPVNGSKKIRMGCHHRHTS